MIGEEVGWRGVGGGGGGEVRGGKRGRKLFSVLEMGKRREMEGCWLNAVSGDRERG